jgi:hypothetical protein
MRLRVRTRSVSPLAVSAFALAALGACSTSPTGTALVVGQQASIEGKVVKVDTTPWTYDGSAVVTVATAAGDVNVQLPARWSLCKAPPPDDVASLKAGDGVQATGEVTGSNEMVVCALPEHRLQRRG